jgi:thioredoxin-like negative regulator of GroEL
VRFLAILLLVALLGCEQPVAPTPLRPQVQVIAFTATWCIPCKEQAALVGQIKATGVTLHRIDVDQQPVLAKRYGVTEVPTYFLFRERQLVLRTNQAQEVLDNL